MDSASLPTCLSLPPATVGPVTTAALKPLFPCAFCQALTQPLGPSSLYIALTLAHYLGRPPKTSEAAGA